MCLVCSRNKSLYNCPTCYIRYCSANCFKNHNSDCTESFSKDRVSGVLNLEAREKEHDKAIEELTAQSVLELAEKLKNNAYSLDSLTGEERELLMCQLSAVKGRSAPLIKTFSPWWSKNNGMQDAQNESEVGGFITTLKAVVPPLCTFPQIRAPPNPAICYQIISVLIAYTVMMRDEDGDSIGVQDSIDFLFSNTVALSDPLFQPSSVYQAMDSWAKTLGHQSVQSRSRKSIQTVLLDVCILLRRPVFTSKALVDVWALIFSRLDSSQHEDSSQHDGGEDEDDSHVLSNIKSYLDVFIRPFRKSDSSMLLNSACRKAFCLLLFSIDPAVEEMLETTYHEFLEYQQLVNTFAGI